MIELGIQKFLLADATLAAIVGTGVFNGRMDKETLLAVVIQVISSTEQQQYHLGAAGTGNVVRLTSTHSSQVWG